MIAVAGGLSSASVAKAETIVVGPDETLRVNEPMTIGPNDTLVIEGKVLNFSTFTNEGTIQVNGALFNDDDSYMYLGGTVNFSAEGRFDADSGAITEVSGSITSEGYFLNRGQMEISGSMVNQGDMDIHGPLEVSGSIVSEGVLFNLDELTVSGSLINGGIFYNEVAMFVTGSLVNESGAHLWNSTRLYGSSGPGAGPVGHLTNRGQLTITSGFIAHFNAETLVNDGGRIEFHQGNSSVRGLTNQANGVVEIQENATLTTRGLLNNIKGRLHIDGLLRVAGELQNHSRINNFGAIYNNFFEAGTIYNWGTLFSCGLVQPTVVGNSPWGIGCP